MILAGATSKNVQKLARELQEGVRGTMAIARREMRDQLRDWRIIFPIILLTLIFPALMNFTAARAVAFVRDYNAEVVGERLIPFLLMIVGFFPISVSLVIALESFVGEKERRSIEPLLCSPLTDAQLYLGKLLASMVPPLIGSYLGIAVYLSGVYLKIGWKPAPVLLVQILTLTTVQAVVMVSGAVVVSSQTTSTRGANLLASFIVIPMAFLIQGESIVMFWAQYSVLWWAIAAQLVIAGLLVRTGLAYFNREEMLGRELDVLDLRWARREFKQGFSGGQNTLAGWYRYSVLSALKEMRPAMVVSAAALVIGALAGIKLAGEFRLPADLVSFHTLGQGFVQGLENMRFLSPEGAGIVWFHNLRAVAIATALGVFSFGVLGLLVLMLPSILIGYVAANVGAAGYSPLAFLLGLVLPHGIVEIPAIIIAGAAILSLGATLTAPARGRSLGEAFIYALARWAKVTLGVVLPLFLIAAILEVYVTPRVAQIVLGR